MWSFEEWMKRVNSYLARKLHGLDSDDMPDFTWNYCWRAGDSPQDAADTAIEYWQEG